MTIEERVELEEKILALEYGDPVYLGGYDKSKYFCDTDELADLVTALREYQQRAEAAKRLLREGMDSTGTSTLHYQRMQDATAALTAAPGGSEGE
jgi:hypothetical protein